MDNCWSYLCLLCAFPWIIALLVGIPWLATLHRKGELVADAPESLRDIF